MPSYEAIIFDFDGVLTDSATIKSAAFRSLYASYGTEIVEAVVAHHAAHEGISRVVKIKHCHKEFLGIDLDDQALASIVGDYQDIVENQVIASDWIEGARELLEFVQGRIPLIVASGTPEDELMRIVAARGMTHYFTEVRGSPDKKEMIVQGAAKQYGFDPHRALFLGDAMTDYHAAENCGCPFIGIVSNPGKNSFPDNAETVQNLFSILERFKNNIDI